jgi:hypothetical protein
MIETLLIAKRNLSKSYYRKSLIHPLSFAGLSAAQATGKAE